MKTIRTLRSKLNLVHDVRHHRTLPYYAEVLTESGKLDAWKLHAETYLRNGDIDPSYLDERGVIKDEIDQFRPQSVYFGVRSLHHPNVLYATGRFVFPKPGQGVESLQLNLDDLDRGWRLALLRKDPAKIVEPASLVKRPGAPSIATLYLFREMLRYSSRHGIETWAFTLHPGMRRAYEARFGHALKRMGDRLIRSGHYKHTYVPYTLDVSEVIDHFATRPKKWMHRIGHDALVDFMFGDYQAVERDLEELQLNKQ